MCSPFIPVCVFGCHAAGEVDASAADCLCSVGIVFRPAEREAALRRRVA